MLKLLDMPVVALSDYDPEVTHGRIWHHNTTNNLVTIAFDNGVTGGGVSIDNEIYKGGQGMVYEFNRHATPDLYFGFSLCINGFLTTRPYVAEQSHGHEALISKITSEEQVMFFGNPTKGLTSSGEKHWKEMSDSGQYHRILFYIPEKFSIKITTKKDVAGRRTMEIEYPDDYQYIPLSNYLKMGGCGEGDAMKIMGEGLRAFGTKYKLKREDEIWRE